MNFQDTTEDDFDDNYDHNQQRNEYESYDVEEQYDDETDNMG